MMPLAQRRKSFLLAALFLGGLVFLPPFLLSAWYREPLEQTLTEACGLRTTIGSMDGSWFRPIEVREVCVGPADDGWPLLTIERVVWRRTILGMIAPEVEQNLDVIGARIRVDEAGLAAWAQVSQALVRAMSSEGKAALTGVVHAGKVRVRFQNVTFVAPQQTTLLRCSGDVSCDSLVQGEPILLQAQAELPHGSQAEVSLLLDAWTLSRTRMEWKVEGGPLDAKELSTFLPSAPPSSGALESFKFLATKDVEGWTAEFSGEGESMTIPALAPVAMTRLSLRASGRLEGTHLHFGKLSAEAAEGALQLWTTTPIALQGGGDRETIQFELSMARPDFAAQCFGLSPEDVTCDRVTLKGDMSGSFREVWETDPIAGLMGLECRFEVDATHLAVGGVRFDALTGEGRVSDHLLNMDRLLLSSEGRLMQGSLRVSLRDPWSGSSMALETLLPLVLPLPSSDSRGLLEFTGRLAASTEGRTLSGTCQGEILRFQAALPTGHRLNLKNVPVTALIGLDADSSQVRLRDVRALARDTDVDLKEVLVSLARERPGVTLSGSARVPLLLERSASGSLDADETCDLTLKGTAQVLLKEGQAASWRGQIEGETGPATIGPLRLDQLRVRVSSDDESGALAGEASSGSGRIRLQGQRDSRGAWNTEVEAIDVACATVQIDGSGEAITFAGRASGTAQIGISASEILGSFDGVWNSIIRSPAASAVPDLKARGTFSARERLQISTIALKGADMEFEVRPLPAERAAVLIWRLPAGLSEMLSHSWKEHLFVLTGRSRGRICLSLDDGSVQGPFELEAEGVRTSNHSYASVSLKGSGQANGLQLSHGRWREGEGQAEVIGFVPVGGIESGLDVSCTLSTYPVRISRILGGTSGSAGETRIVDRASVSGTWSVQKDGDELRYRGEGDVANVLRVMMPKFGDAASFGFSQGALALDGAWNARTQTFTLNHARLQAEQARVSISGLRAAKSGVSVESASVHVQGNLLNAVLWDWQELALAAEGSLSLDLESSSTAGGPGVRFDLSLDHVWIGGCQLSGLKVNGTRSDDVLEWSQGSARLRDLNFAFTEGSLGLASLKIRLRGDVAGPWSSNGIGAAQGGWETGFWHPLLAGSRITADGPVSGTFGLDGDLSDWDAMEGFLRFRTSSFSAFPLPVLSAVADQIPSAMRASLPLAQQDLWSPLPLAFRPLASRGMRFEPTDVSMVLNKGWLLPESTIALRSAEGEFVARRDKRVDGSPVIYLETDLPERLRKRTPVGQTPLTPIQMRVSTTATARGPFDATSIIVEILP